ncbi:384_t:CDS:2, partial [Gigaspora margarita]
FVWDCSGVLVSWSAIGGRLVSCVADVVTLVGVLETGSLSISIMLGREWAIGTEVAVVLKEQSAKY